MIYFQLAKAGLQTIIKLPAFATSTLKHSNNKGQRHVDRLKEDVFVCLFVCLFLFPMHIPWFVFNHHAHLGKLCSSRKQPLYKARFATKIIIKPVLQLFPLVLCFLCHLLFQHHFTSPHCSSTLMVTFSCFLGKIRCVFAFSRIQEHSIMFTVLLLL